MSANLNLVKSSQSDGVFATNEDVFENDVTISSGYSSTVSGPVTIPNLTVAGHLNNLNVTGTLNVTGSMNFLG
jgi:hypothetical protein